MHELAIAQSLLDAVRSHMHANGASRVVSVRVRVGELSTVDPESLAFCFQEIARGTPVAKAKVEIVEIPARYACGECDHGFGGSPLEAGRCPACGSGLIEVKQGKELELVELEME